MNSHIQKLCDDVADELGIPKDVARFAYESYWAFIRDRVESLDIASIKDKKEVESMRTSFNLPVIGKLMLIKNIIGYKIYNDKKQNGKDSLKEND